MKYAKSIRLGGELIDAVNGSHDDCKMLDMVCDCCGESVVFRKGHTKTRGEKVIEIPPIWVHRVYKETSQECELRVNNTSVEAVNAKRNEQRGQRYELLSKSFVDMLFNFNDVHFKRVKELNYSSSRLYKDARKLWKTRLYFEYKELIHQIHKFIVASVVPEDISILDYAFGIPVDFGDGVEIDIQEFFQNKHLKKHHIMLTREVLNFCLTNCITKNNVLSPFHFAMSGILTSRTYSDDKMHSKYNLSDVEYISACFIRLLVTTDWTAAFEWAKTQVKEKRGFGK